MRPILLCGSAVWGVNVSANTPIDKLLFYYMRCVLHVKSTTSNVIVVGECGQLPPSVYCHINGLSYLKRLSDLPDTKIAKQVYNELDKLHQCGVKTWVTKARELAEQYEVDISSNIHNFKKCCKITISNCYKHRWLLEVTNFKPKPNITDIFNVQNGIPLREIPWGHNRLSLSDSYDLTTLQFTYFGNWTREIYST